MMYLTVDCKTEKLAALLHRPSLTKNIYVLDGRFVSLLSCYVIISVLLCKFLILSTSYLFINSETAILLVSDVYYTLHGKFNNIFSLAYEAKQSL